MNGNQIEHVLQLIDQSLQNSSDEATKYIRENQAAIAQSIAQTGSAMVRTSAGDFRLSVEDLEAAAA